MICLFLAFTFVSAQSLKPFYPDGYLFISFNIGKQLMLSCEAKDNTKIKWMKEDKLVSEIPELKGHYDIKGKEGKFIIEKTREEDAGNYSCIYENESSKFEVYGNVIVKIPQNIYVVENEKMEITCLVRGTNPVITWEYSNGTNDARMDIKDIDDPRIKFENHDDIEGSKLIVEPVKMSDRGSYICVGSNSVMDLKEAPKAESDGYVRVKDKLAALWPFLGICAEVFILCTIILIYEKRRNKTDLEESDTDQSPDQKK